MTALNRCTVTDNVWNRNIIIRVIISSLVASG